MLISTALLLDSIIRNSVCTPAKLPCRRVEVGYDYPNSSEIVGLLVFRSHLLHPRLLKLHHNGEY
jgi:hypothetical protein